MILNIFYNLIRFSYLVVWNAYLHTQLKLNFSKYFAFNFGFIWDCKFRDSLLTLTHLYSSQVCRLSPDGPNSVTFYFRGCWTIFVEKIDNNINIVVGVAIGVIVLMVIIEPIDKQSTKMQGWNRWTKTENCTLFYSVQVCSWYSYQEKQVIAHSPTFIFPRLLLTFSHFFILHFPFL